MAQLEIFAVKQTRKLVISETSNEAYDLPSFHQGDTLSIAFTLLSLLSKTSAPYFAKIETSKYTVRIGLFLKDGTVLSEVEADAFVEDSGSRRYTAILPLNTDAIDDAIDANSDEDITDAVIEIEVTEVDSSGTTTVYRNKTVTIEFDYLQNATQAIVTGATAATQAWTKAGFVERYATKKSERFEKAEDGTMWRIWRGADGIEKQEAYTPV